MSIIVYKSERTMSNYASQWHLSSQHPCKIPMPRSNRHKTAAEDAEEFPMLEHWKAFTETKGGGGDLPRNRAESDSRKEYLRRIGVVAKERNVSKKLELICRVEGTHRRAPRANHGKLDAVGSIFHADIHADIHHGLDQKRAARQPERNTAQENVLAPLLEVGFERTDLPPLWPGSRRLDSRAGGVQGPARWARICGQGCWGGAERVDVSGRFPFSTPGDPREATFRQEVHDFRSD